VAKVPFPGENHRHIMFVCGFNDFLVANAAAGLND
jgi:hypothetical protein